MLNRADPVDVGGERVEVEGQPLYRRPGTDVEDALGNLLLGGVDPPARDLQADGAAQAQHQGAGERGGRWSASHLKSRREKMMVEAMSSTAI